jgi:hypothetical protein
MNIQVPDLLAGKRRMREVTAVTVNWVMDGVDLIAVVWATSHTPMLSMHGFTIAYSVR